MEEAEVKPCGCEELSGQSVTREYSLDSLAGRGRLS